MIYKCSIVKYTNDIHKKSLINWVKLTKKVIPTVLKVTAPMKMKITTRIVLVII